MTSTNLFAELVNLQYRGIRALITLHSSVSSEQEILQARADVERAIKDMKAMYFDLVDAGGPAEANLMIFKLQKAYEEAPYFNAMPITDDTVIITQAELCATSEMDANHERMRVKSSGRREPLWAYNAQPSTLKFARGDLIRTPITSHDLIMPAWFYVNEVITTSHEVKLRGWRVGENDQRAREKYREQRIVSPDQYTYIERRDVTRMELGLENF